MDGSNIYLLKKSYDEILNWIIFIYFLPTYRGEENLIEKNVAKIYNGLLISPI